MWRRPGSEPSPRSRDGWGLTISGVLIGATAILLLARERRPEWDRHQRAFRSLVGQTYGRERAEHVPHGYQQIWVRGLTRADRCVICHLAIRWKGLESTAHPLRTHPPEILKSHPPERFGCTTCHGGDGAAVDRETAHGQTPGALSPLLGKDRNEGYGILEERAVLLEINCNLCHRHEAETHGTDFINHAKRLLKDKGCRACHLIAGRGGAVGPDLSFVGDRFPDQFDYTRLVGRPTTFAWHVAHFRDPRAVVPDSVMPHFDLSARDAQALTLLVLSWRSTRVPSSLLPGVTRTDRVTPEETEAEDQVKRGPGAWFVKTGCFVCHAVAALGVKSPAPIGPDLSTAVDDTINRFGRDLGDFLRRPTGTMAVVFARQIPLTPDQKAQAMALLTQAATATRRKQDGMGVTSNPHIERGGEDRKDGLRFDSLAPEDRRIN